MKERRVIDIEHDLADEGEGVPAVSVCKDAHVSRDQAAKRIKREMTNRRFDTTAMQFFNNSRTRAPAKTFTRQIPPAADGSRNEENYGKSQNGNPEPPREGRLSISRGTS